MSKTWKKYPPIEAAWAERGTIVDASRAIRSDGTRVLGEAETAIREGRVAWERGDAIRRDDRRRYIEGDQICAKAEKAICVARKTRSEAESLFADSDLVYEESTLLYVQAVRWVSENAVIDWTDGSFEVEEEV